jgi:hypothetical protein
MDVKRCSECSREAPRLRKERCDACYMRLYRGGDVPVGSVCAGCDERRRELLCQEDVHGKPEIVCGNCALLLRRARPRLASVSELRGKRVRDRRRGGGAAAGERRRSSDRAAAVGSARPAFDVSVD